MREEIYLSELREDMLTDELIDRVLYDIGSEANELKNADAIIVLGSKKAWEYRVPTAAMLFTAGAAPVMLLTGGRVQESEFGSLPEWESMLIAAERLGVPRAAILTERRALNTVENFRFSRRIIMEKLPDCRTALIVTTAYHMRRALLIAERKIPEVRFLPVPVQKGSAARGNWRDTAKGRATAAAEVIKLSRCAANGTIKDRRLCEL